MAGPYCRDCKHYYPSLMVKEQGECMDPTKLIYYKYGGAKNEPPEVHETDTCQRWEYKGGEETPLPEPGSSPTAKLTDRIRITRAFKAP